MRPHVRRTATLALAALLLVAVDVAAHRASVGGGDDLPAVEAVDPAGVQRVRLTQGDDQVVIERREEAWRMTAPTAHRADPEAVEALLQVLRKGIRMDVEIGRGDLETYGLKSPAAVRVQVEGTDGALADFYVGHDAAGGTTFLRFPDDDAVFRARIGGRSRFARGSAGWRDHHVLSVDPTLVDHVRIEPEAAPALDWVRESGTEGAEGRWTLADDPAFAPDQQALDELARVLAGLRAGAILDGDHPAGLEAPLARVEVGLSTGETHELLFRRTPDGTFVTRTGGDAVYRIAPVLVERLVLPIDAWRDRRLLDIDPARLKRLRLVEPTLTTVLEHDAASASWRIVEPANVAVDAREAARIAGALAQLRADGLADVPPEEVGFPSSTRVELTTVDGRTHVLELGRPVPGAAQGQEAVFVRTAEFPDRIAVLSARKVSLIRKAFSR